MPGVGSIQPVDVRLWVALDVHKLSIVAAILPPRGGQPEVQEQTCRDEAEAGRWSRRLLRATRLLKQALWQDA